jgi:hypothetical protein
MKATLASDALKLQQIPNIGPAMVEDFKALGITLPGQLVGADPFALYRRLCRISGTRQDPCVLDTFISAVRFMEGGPAYPWWHYTAERKRQYPDL